MHFRLHPILEPDWPALAWIARCERSNPVITVRHGPQVETREDWLCEAVWDGEFEAGDFDRTDLVFGSGIRLRDEGIIFVPAGATVDRLQFLELSGTTWVSNSMACLLGVSGVKVDPTYDRYFDFYWSVTKGFDGYERRMPTTGTCPGTTRGRSAVASWRRPESPERPSACTRRRLRITSGAARRC